MIESKLTGESKDILEENITKMKELFPEIITEDKIDFDKLKLLLSDDVDDSPERYSFNWNGKSKAIAEAQKPSTGTLRPVKEESKDWDSTENLYIEGDNLEVLKLLQKSYYGKIKMIYIDPPYNTGKDFVYKDSYKDNLENYLEISGQAIRDDSLYSENKESNKKLLKLSTNTENKGMFHTNWLNMIYPRLKLAKNLLTDEGIIFISIDDNEVYNLKKVCDEIFGDENFVSSLIPILNPRGSQSSKEVAINHEYILIYSKTSNKKMYGFDLTQQQKKEYNKLDSKGHYREIGLRKRGADSRREDSPNLFYPIYYNEKTNEITITPKEQYIKIIPKLSDNSEGRWRWSKEKVNLDSYQLIAREVRRKDGSREYDIFQKDYLTNDKMRKPMSVWTQKDINNEIATEMIQSLFESKVFDYTKSIYLIKSLLKISTEKNSIILDFFAGSSTTAHSTIEINNEDNGNRKFVMIQLPEPTNEKSEAFKVGYKNISDIGKERIKRAGDKIKSKSNNKELDIGFKVFKLDSSNLNKWNPDFSNVEQSVLDSEDNLVPGRTELDLVYEIMIKYGIDLTLPIEEYEINNKKVYSIGFGALLICLDNNITKEIAIPLIELKNELSPEASRVVFKDNGFASDSDKTNIKETLKTNGINEFITI